MTPLQEAIRSRDELTDENIALRSALAYYASTSLYTPLNGYEILREGGRGARAILSQYEGETE
ncbi:hypothetical protein SD71_10700 [Cohnella kolymensis]|uniref:Uncharacterized protein n=1 Tax=Cohnella kolymensis TaxID=1590652 RepID=A0ABR5A4C9_9BACL|nr:hypothetical protein [Cohnella kolymensis]KIL35855.1 hypothetical protein SD71_10700 [Cohnella kolymensis]